MATTWNPADNTGVTLSNGNLTTASNGSGSGVRATAAKSSGKVYFEFTVVTVNFYEGIAILAIPVTSFSSSATGGCMLAGANAGVYRDGTFQFILGSVSIGDVGCVALDMDNKRIWFRLNAGNWNNNATYNPATNVGGVDISGLFAAAAAYPAYGSFTGSGGTTTNFGATAFVQVAPSGFTAFDPPPVTVVTTPPPRPNSSAPGGRAWETLYRDYLKQFGEEYDEDEETALDRYLRRKAEHRVRIGRQGYD